MTRKPNTLFSLLFCLTLLLTLPALAEAEDEHAPAVLKEGQVTPIAELAQGLSKYGTWVSEPVLAALEEKSLSIDEIFELAPRFLEVDGRHYRLVIEKMGQWKGFQTGDEFAIFLSHEIYDGLGKGALAYLGGEELAFYAEDLQIYPALAVTLAEVSRTEVSPKYGVVSLTDTFAIGKVRDELAGTVAPTKMSCRSTPSCSGTNNFSCPDGAETWFVVNKVLIETKHEGGLFAKPEIEMYVAPFQNGSSTTLLFNGGTITDPAGDSRTLPDVNKKNQWYTVNGGVAIEPFAGSFSMVDLIEDDDTAGVYVAIPDDEFAGQVLAFESSFSCNQTTRDFDPSGTDFKLNGSIKCIETNCMPEPPGCGGTGSLCSTTSDCCSGLSCQSIQLAGLKLCLP